MIYCLFEQSGTFKNEFIKYGFQAKDFDILNDFNETDVIIDLYKEIEECYRGGQTMFDKITNKDLIIAFFPCIRFENQILLAFRGDQYQDKNKDIEFLLERDMILHEELHHNYNLITKLALICIKRGLRLIIENPYSTQHYLTRYWALKPSIIDCDRSRRGDFYKKPTQYYFINIKPTTNIVMDYIEESKEVKTIRDTHDKVERSLISKEYASRFIKEFIGLEQI